MSNKTTFIKLTEADGMTMIVNAESIEKVSEYGETQSSVTYKNKDGFNIFNVPVTDLILLIASIESVTIREIKKQ